MKRFALALLLCASASASDWTRFRGPNGTGVSDDKGVPVRWTGNEKTVWKIPLPGLGHSSPVIVGDELYITTAEDEGKVRDLLALKAADGSVRWKKSLPAETHPIHKKSSFASSTPTVDAERVYVVFSTAAQLTVRAYARKDGTEVWSRELGEFISQHGSGTSPILYKDMVILGNDQGGKTDPPNSDRDGKSFLVALDARSGAVRWKTDRATGVVAYSSPILVEGKRTELIFTSQAEGICGFDPDTGKRLWQVNGLPQRPVGSPVFVEGVVVAAAGQGRGGKTMLAVKPGGEGDVSKTHVAWSGTKQLPYVPTPIAYGKHLFLIADAGIATCVDPKTGEQIWTERLGGDVAASPVIADGKIYVVSEAGDVHTFAAAGKFQLLGKSTVGEPVYATPAIAGGRLFIRTHKSLICIGER